MAISGFMNVLYPDNRRLGYFYQKSSDIWLGKKKFISKVFKEVNLNVINK